MSTETICELTTPALILDRRRLEAKARVDQDPAVRAIVADHARDRPDGDNQKHGILTSRTNDIDIDHFPVGSRVKILPNHACATAAAYGRYHVTDGGAEIVDVWERINGW